jgi:hypothetical protein
MILDELERYFEDFPQDAAVWRRNSEKAGELADFAAPRGEGMPDSSKAGVL